MKRRILSWMLAAVMLCNTLSPVSAQEFSDQPQTIDSQAAQTDATEQQKFTSQEPTEPLTAPEPEFADAPVAASVGDGLQDGNSAVGLRSEDNYIRKSIYYFDGTQEIEKECIVVATGVKKLGEPGQNTWYVVIESGKDGIAAGGRITIQGNVHLILENGSYLNATNGGIKVEEGNSLTIYSQNNDTDEAHTESGELKAWNENNPSVLNAGIGGDKEKNAGKIIIHGGKITAGHENGNGAGIGNGANRASCEGIEIKGGTVNAYSGEGAGIGDGVAGGVFGSCKEIKISGGTVNAYSNSGAGIGSGELGSCEKIEISGGTVNASSNSGAGIGSGSGDHTGGFCKEIKISGGTVNASSGWGAGIGSGTGASCEKIEISGGTVNASSGSGAGIGSGQYGSCQKIEINDGTIELANSPWGAGIGSGQAGSCTEILISGGEIKKASSTNGAGIGKGAAENNVTGECGKIYAIGGLINASKIESTSGIRPSVVDNYGNASKYEIYGNPTLDFSWTIAANTSWEFSENATLTIGTNGTLNIVGKFFEPCKNSGIGDNDSRITGTRTKVHKPQTINAFGEQLKAECNACNKTATLTLTKPQNLTYNGTAKEATFSGNTDNWNTLVGTVPSITYSTGGNINAGNVTASASAGGKTAQLTYNIEKCPVKVSGITAKDKSYDGNKTAVLDCTAAQFDGKLNNDNLTVTATGTFKDANVGEKKKVDISNLALNGASAANYKIADEGNQTETKATISKVSNGWTTELSINGWTYGDSTNLPSAQAKFGTVTYTYSADNGKTYTATVPTAAGNYKVKATVEGNENYNGMTAEKSFTIAQRPVKVSGITANDKPYDGNTSADLDYSSAVLTGKLSSDELTVTATGTFKNADAGENKTVNISNLVLAGAAVANYKIADNGNQEETTAKINPANLTGVSVRQTGTLTYNGEAQTATVTKNATAVKNETVTFTYSDKENDGYSNVVPSFTTAGDHTVWYQASAANHNTEKGSFIVKISKADASLTATQNQYTKKDTDPAFGLREGISYTGDGTLQYEVIGNSNVLKVSDIGQVTILSTGEATIKVSANQSSNYNAVANPVYIKITSEHDWDITITKEPTCDTAGEKSYKCKKDGCAGEKQEIIPAGHDFSEKVTTVYPDCTSGGYTIYKCKRCDKTEKKDYTSAYGHSPEADDGDCTTSVKCKSCGSVAIEAKPAHALTDYQSNQDKTHIENCTNSGCTYKTTVSCTFGKDNVCEDCGYERITIKKQTSSTTVRAGSPVTLSVTASGSRIDTYQWQYIPASEALDEEMWKDIPKANKAKYTVTLSTKESGIRYRCVASNKGDSAYSAPIILNVKDASSFQPDTDTSDFNPSVGTKFSYAKAVNGTAKVTLGWKKVKGADGYQIYWYNRKTEKYEHMKTVLDAKVTTYTTRNLTYGQNQLFKIRAFSVNKKGDRTYGKFGSSVKVKTGPAATTAKTVKSSKKQQVTVTWKKVSNADGYQIYRSTGKNGTYTKMTTITGNKTYTKTLKNQKSGKKYYYKVRAYITGTDGKRIYGKFSTPKSVKIK